jgi:hypothetical protein
MDTDIKMVDLRKESLNNAKEAIRLASAMGAKNFKLFVNSTFVRNGLINGKIVPLSIEAPPKTQLLLNLTDLKNLKKTVDFAKKMLVDDGEATVEEKEIPLPVPVAITPVVAPVTPTEELSSSPGESQDEETQLDEEVSEEVSEESEVSSGLPELLVVGDKASTPTPKKRKNKKGASGKKSE